MATASTNLSLIKPEVTDTTVVRTIYNTNLDTIDGRFSATYMAVQAKASVSITGGSITGITDLAIADGGTGSSTAANARTALGLAIGSDIQSYDAGLLSIAALTTTADKMIYTTALDTYAVTALTAFARTILDDANAATVRTTIGAIASTVTTLSSLTSIGTITTGGLGTGAVLAGVTMTLGSDADGDIYYRASNVLTRLAKGTATQVLAMNSGATAPEWVAAGAGDVTKVGTPANSQVGVWTGNGTIEGAASLTYDGSNLQLTGDIGSTGTRITKGWFANLETTGDLTVNGTALASIYATLGANTNITSILNAALYIGRDADNQIKFATDNNIVFRLAGADGALFNATGELDMNAHSVGFTQQTITYNVTTTTVDWKLSNKATVTLTGNVGTFAFTNPTNPCNILLKIVQDATGSRLVTAWDADIKWVGGAAPTLTTGANTIDVVSFYFDGSSYYGVASLAFA